MKELKGIKALRKELLNESPIDAGYQQPVVTQTPVATPQEIQEKPTIKRKKPKIEQSIARDRIKKQAGKASKVLTIENLTPKNINLYIKNRIKNREDLGEEIKKERISFADFLKNKAFKEENMTPTLKNSYLSTLLSLLRTSSTKSLENISSLKNNPQYIGFKNSQPVTPASSPDASTSSSTGTTGTASSAGTTGTTGTTGTAGTASSAGTTKEPIPTETAETEKELKSYANLDPKDAEQRIIKLRDDTLGEIQGKIEEYQRNSGNDSMSRQRQAQMQRHYDSAERQFNRFIKATAAGPHNAGSALLKAESLSRKLPLTMTRIPLKGFLRRDTQAVGEALKKAKERGGAALDRLGSTINKSERLKKTAETIGKVRGNIKQGIEDVAGKMTASSEAKVVAAIQKELGKDKADQYLNGDKATKDAILKEINTLRRSKESEAEKAKIGAEAEKISSGTAPEKEGLGTRTLKALKNRINKPKKVPTEVEKLDLRTPENKVPAPVAATPATITPTEREKFLPQTNTIPPKVIEAGLEGSWNKATSEKQKQNILNMATAKLNAKLNPKAVGEATRVVFKNILG